jgi:multiple sugar transport system substrate-binding protein
VDSTRKLRLGAIAAALAVAVTGCGIGGSSGHSSKTITIAYQEQLDNNNRVQDKFLKQAVSQFEKANPGTTVKLVPVTATENDYYTKIDLMMRSPVTAPDLVYEDTAVINSDAASGYLLPINKYVSSWSGWSQYSPRSKSAVSSPSGQVYGVPDTTDTRGIWYNKQIFAKAGIPVPWQPKNWNDILTAARQIKAKVPGVYPLNVFTGVAQGEAATMQGFEMLLYGTPSANNSMYDYSAKKWVVDSKDFTNALTFLHTVFSQHLGPPTQMALAANFQDTVATNLLPSGKLAMDIDGSWLPNNWLSTGAKPWPQWQSVLGLATMPTEFGQGSDKVSLSGGWAWSIPAKGKNPDLAWKFIESVETEASSAKWNAMNATLAVRQDVGTDPTYLNALPSNKFFSSLLPYTYYRPTLPVYTQVSTAVQQAMESVTSGQATVAKAASTYASAVSTAVGAGDTIKGAP